LNYSPRRQQVIYMLSFFKAQLGKVSESVELLNQSIKDDPKISEGYWRLAYIYAISGDLQKAKETLSVAHEKGVIFDEQGQKIESLILSPEFLQQKKK